MSAQYIRTVYWYPPLENTDGYFIYAVLSHIQKQHNGKEGRNSKGELVVLAEGANVICSNGKHVGNVECIYINPRQNQATHILITDELRLKEKKLIPTRWLTDVFKQEIHLSVDSELLASLPEYQIQT